MTDSSIEHRVRRDDYRTQACVEGIDPDAPLEPGQIMVRVERFALTANNVTYATVGEQVGYWSFFPAPADWGRVPAWGFGRVLRSAHEGIGESERLYGYLPMASHALMTVGAVTEGALTEGSPHRAALPAAYNHYVRLHGEPDVAKEGITAVLRPVFMASFLLDDQLAEVDRLDSLVLTSASSKTALGLALLAGGRPERRKIVGLTSPLNLSFTMDTGLYDRVLTYGDLKGLDDLERPAVVDFAGGGQTLAALHSGLSGRLTKSVRVGVTHWDAPPAAEPVAPPEPEWFFAPDRIRVRAREWGREGFDERFNAAFAAFATSAERWLTIEPAHGCEALESRWRNLLDTGGSPAKGYVISL